MNASLLPDSTNSSAVAIPYVGWEPEPNFRGTLSLIWSCLSVLFICIWTVQHFEADELAIWGWNNYTFGTCFVRIFFPEITIGLAVVTWIQARRGQRTLKIKDRRWTAKHFSLAVMNGVVVTGKQETAHGEEKSDFQEIIDSEGLAWLINNELIDVSQISMADIKARSKSDSLLKTVTAIQSLWLAIDVVARATSHLPISQLEALSLAYVYSAITAYAFWWNTPQNVSEPFTIDVGYLTPDQRSELTGAAFALSSTNLWFLVAVSGAIFGGIHFIALREYFPTQIEKILWWISCGITTILPGIIVVFQQYLLPDGGGAWNKSNLLLKVLYVLLNVLYAFAKIAVLVICFTSLRSQPKTLYEQVRWVNLLPHI